MDGSYRAVLFVVFTLPSPLSSSGPRKDTERGEEASPCSKERKTITKLRATPGGCGERERRERPAGAQNIFMTRKGLSLCHKFCCSHISEGVRGSEPRAVNWFGYASSTIQAGEFPPLVCFRSRKGPQRHGV